MKLSGFSINEDFVSLRHTGRDLDLHNSYQFVELHQSVPQASVVLRWLRREDEWVSADLPANVQLTFSGVHLFRVTPRDPEMPPAEDACLDKLGFLWDDLLEEMSGCAKVVPEPGCSHFCVLFSGGSAIKLGAAEATLNVSPSA